MLKTAYQYREELNKIMCEIAFDTKFLYYSISTYWNYDQKIGDSSWDSMQFVSVGEGNHIIGYLSADIARDHCKVGNLSIISFSQGINLIFSHDLGEFLSSLFDKFNYRKIEFSVVVGNPIERSYDKIVAKYGGRIVGIKRESVRLMDNNYYDMKLYEIFKADYRDAMKRMKNRGQ